MVPRLLQEIDLGLPFNGKAIDQTFLSVFLIKRNEAFETKKKPSFQFPHDPNQPWESYSSTMHLRSSAGDPMGGYWTHATGTTRV